MSIKSLYKDYFQKSRVFLYPVLDIKRVSSITPICTYTSWKGHYEIGEAKLVCLYHLRNDAEFRAFEKSKLFGNRLFHDFKETADGKAVYIFDLSPFQQDWNNFIHGKYSKLSNEHKKKIQNFYGYRSPNYPYVESFLYPEKYYKMYSEVINVKEHLLKEVIELCDKPDFEQETLIATVKSLEMKREMQ